jgi:hypothetical protein
MRGCDTILSREVNVGFSSTRVFLKTGLASGTDEAAAERGLASTLGRNACSGIIDREPSLRDAIWGIIFGSLSEGFSHLF